MPITDILGPATSLARSLIRPSLAMDVVGITGPGFAPMFPLARPLVASVYEAGELMEHPLEDGSLIADHLVVLPVEIDLPMMVVGEYAYRSTYAAIQAAFRAGTIFTVVTRTGSYASMVLLEIPHEEDPRRFDAIEILVRLREARFVTPKTGEITQAQAENPEQSSTVQRGQQQTTATNAASTSSTASSYSASGAGPTPSGSTLYQWTYGP